MVRLEILEMVINAKKAYKENDLKRAWKYWCKLYDTLNTDSEKNLREYHQSMELFTNEEVYDITDYGKKINGYA